MSDTDLRALERRARATGHVEDAAALLRARVRRGDLSPERLRLAAYAGDQAARAAEGTLCSGGPKGGHTGYCDERCGVPTSLASHVAVLSRFGSIGRAAPLRTADVLVRAAVAAARAALTSWVAEACDGECNMEDRDCPRTSGPTRAVEAAEEWLACPCARHVAALREPLL